MTSASAIGVRDKNSFTPWSTEAILIGYGVKARRKLIIAKSWAALYLSSVNKMYILRWWILAVAVIAPLIIITVSIISGGQYAIASLSVPIGLWYSFPTFLFMFAILHYLEKNKVNPVKSKWILNGAAGIGVALTFYLIMDAVIGWLPFIYMVSVILSSFCLHLRESE